MKPRTRGMELLLTATNPAAEIRNKNQLHDLICLALLHHAIVTCRHACALAGGLLA